MVAAVRDSALWEVMTVDGIMDESLSVTNSMMLKPAFLASERITCQPLPHQTCPPNYGQHMLSAMFEQCNAASGVVCSVADELLSSVLLSNSSRRMKLPMPPDLHVP